MNCNVSLKSCDTPVLSAAETFKGLVAEYNLSSAANELRFALGNRRNILKMFIHLIFYDLFILYLKKSQMSKDHYRPIVRLMDTIIYSLPLINLLQ